MIVSNIYKNLCRSRLLSCSGALSSAGNLQNERLTDRGHLKKSRTTAAIFFAHKKYYSSETETNPSVLLPPLSDHPVALWPKIFTSFRNFFIINMGIKSQVDPEFKEFEFMNASKQALYLVSRLLANEDYERLEGLVIPETIETLKQRISALSDYQKRLITVEEDDVYLSFPDFVGIVDKDANTKTVEIMVVHHYMQGFGRMKRTGETLGFDHLETNKERIFVANYRYFRDYSKGVDSSWTLNIVNHLSPMILVNPSKFDQRVDSLKLAVTQSERIVDAKGRLGRQGNTRKLISR